MWDLSLQNVDRSVESAALNCVPDWTSNAEKMHKIPWKQKRNLILLILFWSHVTRPNQSLSLFRSVGTGRREPWEWGCWNISFLGNRKPRVVVDGKLTGYVDVNRGVPQGTVLGPLLFSLVVNNIKLQSWTKVLGQLYSPKSHQKFYHQQLYVVWDQTEMRRSNLKQSRRLQNPAAKCLEKWNVPWCQRQH